MIDSELGAVNSIIESGDASLKQVPYLNPVPYY